MKLLIIEDDEHILAFLKRGLLEDGYTIEIAMDGNEGVYMATLNVYDVIILDWMLPCKNGIQVLSEIKKENIQTPILMLTAKDDIKDKVQGLNAGADDYLSKPFAYEELIARIEALYRRSLSQGMAIIEIGTAIRIDISTKNVTRNNQSIVLTSKEYDLLLLLVKHRNSLVSLQRIEDELWNNDEFINSNVIQVTIYHLRQKIGKNVIQSYRGLGYKIEI